MTAIFEAQQRSQHVENGPIREENAPTEENVIFPEDQHGDVNRGEPDTQTQPLQLNLVDQTMDDVEDEDLKLELREVQIRRRLLDRKRRRLERGRTQRTIPRR